MITIFKSTRSKQFIGILFLSLLSLTYIFYSSQNPNKPVPPVSLVPTPTPQDVHSESQLFNQLDISKITFTFPSFPPAHPASLPVYSASIIPENINLLGEELVNYFNLTPSERDRSLFLSQDKTISMNLVYSQQIINFTYSPSSYPAKEKYSLSQAKTAANNFKNNFTLLKNLALNEENITSYSLNPADPHFERENSPANANFFEIRFQNFVNSYPYFESGKSNAVLTVFVGPGNTIYKFNYNSQPLPQLTDPQDKQTYTHDESAARLNSGFGEIIFTNPMDTPFDNSLLPDITIDSYQIEYRYNSIKKLIVPFYRFKGTYLSDRGIQTPIDIILPAVEL